MCDPWGLNPWPWCCGRHALTGEQTHTDWFQWFYMERKHIGFNTGNRRFLFVLRPGCIFFYLSCNKFCSLQKWILSIGSLTVINSVAMHETPVTQRSLTNSYNEAKSHIESWTTLNATPIETTAFARWISPNKGNIEQRYKHPQNWAK